MDTEDDEAQSSAGVRGEAGASEPPRGPGRAGAAQPSAGSGSLAPGSPHRLIHEAAALPPTPAGPAARPIRKVHSFSSSFGMKAVSPLPFHFYAWTTFDLYGLNGVVRGPSMPN
ncbi:hypothetical protein AAFF_G00243820 [Aldrovandia affinis]|uniref:Uncharacterized protein n=1 Tax=Aldrovandia affinis TaxID=143900 RepID=A0AAD7W304_9TELE|nr:hypothetical protein AAFF_G00243820 [Aldrovandia affinis]